MNDKIRIAVGIFILILSAPLYPTALAVGRLGTVFFLPIFLTSLLLPLSLTYSAILFLLNRVKQSYPFLFFGLIIALPFYATNIYLRVFNPDALWDRGDYKGIVRHFNKEANQNNE